MERLQCAADPASSQFSIRAVSIRPISPAAPITLHTERMTDPPHDQSQDGEPSRPLKPWGALGEHGGEPAIVWDRKVHAAWLQRWAPRCPVGSAQRPAHPSAPGSGTSGRVALGDGDHGVGDVIVHEQDDEVYVHVVVDYGERDDKYPSRAREYTDCPVGVWLEKPLGRRAVIDVDFDEELSLFAPSWLDGVRQPDAGDCPANRRRERFVAPERCCCSS